MGQGMQVFDASGNLAVDITDRLSRIVGQFSTGTSDGSISIPEFANAQGWFNAFDTSENFFGTVRRPYFSISSSGISWTFGGSGPLQYVSITVVYGVF